MSTSIASVSLNEGVVAPVAAAGRRRALMELMVGYGLILVVIWTPRPWQRWFYFAALAWIAAVMYVSFDGWKGWGLKGAGLVGSLWVVGVATVAALIAVWVAYRMGTLHGPQNANFFFRTFSGYTIWSFLQQFLLQDYVLWRLLRLMGSKRAAVLTAAGLFALAHLPSPILTTLTLVWGAMACWLFLRYRNVYTLGMAHAIMGVCLAITVPGHVDHNMRVGLGYLRYHPPGLQHGAAGQRSQSDHSTSTDVWVMADDPMRRS